MQTSKKFYKVFLIHFWQLLILGKDLKNTFIEHFSMKVAEMQQLSLLCSYNATIQAISERVYFRVKTLQYASAIITFVIYIIQ